MISAAIRGNVLGCGNYRKSLSFDLATRSVLHQTPTTNPLLLLEDRFKNSPLPFPLPPFRNRTCSLFPPLSAPEKRIETKYGGERMATWMVNFWIHFGEKKTEPENWGEMEGERDRWGRIPSLCPFPDVDRNEGCSSKSRSWANDPPKRRV